MFVLPTIMVAQDIHFSQFTLAPMQLDPSQAGKIGGDDRVVINYRNQWGSVASPFNTYGLSYDKSFNRGQQRDNFFGAGITAYSDKAGDINLGTTLMNLSIAYHVRMSENSYLTGGIKVGAMQRSVDLSQARFGNQFDGAEHNALLESSENFGAQSFFRPDFAAGISYSFGTINNKVMSNNGFEDDKVNVGIAVHHVSSPDIQFLKDSKDDLSFRYVFHTISSFGVRGSNMAIQPSFVGSFQNGAKNILLGAYFRYNLKEKSKFTKFSNGAALSIGTHYRFGDAFIPSVLMEMGSFSVGISYDLNLSDLSTASNGNGGMEIGVRYISPNPFVKKSAARFF